MGNKVSLLDSGFKNLPIEEKRVALVIMDIMLKKLHENGLMVTDFSPHNIYFQNGIYSFEKIAPISSIVAENKDEAVLNNVIWMSVVALWGYNSNPSYNLISPLFVSNNFDSFAFWYPEEDRAYYQSVLIDSYRSGKIATSNIYFSDYVVEQHKKQSSSDSNSLAYVKATNIGKVFANKDEAAFGHNFFFISMAVSLTIALTGIIFYFASYLG